MGTKPMHRAVNVIIIAIDFVFITALEKPNFLRILITRSRLKFLHLHHEMNLNFGSKKRRTFGIGWIKI